MRGILAHALVLAATFLLSSLAGCSAAGPQVDVLTPLPAGVDPPVFVTAARQKDAIVRSLQAAGFRVVDAPGPGVYLMRVTIGVSQDFRPCGALNNVRYALRDRQETVIVAEAKGWTGTCDPNVFDEVGRALRARVVSSIEEGNR